MFPSLSWIGRQLPPDSRRQGRAGLFNFTPDHWHALATIWPARPARMSMSRSPRRTASGKAARWSRPPASTSAIVQLGTQTRSGRYTARGGRVHPVGQARQGAPRARAQHEAAWTHRAPGGWPRRRASTTTCGSGRPPKRPFNPNRFHYNWHWFWDYSGGDIINDGVHQIDFARWLIGKAYPKSAVQPTGGKFYLRRRPGDSRHAGRHLGFRQAHHGLRDGPVDAVHEEDAVGAARQADTFPTGRSTACGSRSTATRG